MARAAGSGGTAVVRAAAGPAAPLARPGAGRDAGAPARAAAGPRAGSEGTGAGGAGTGGSGRRRQGTGGSEPNCVLPPTDAGVPAAMPDNVVFLPNVTVTTLAGGPTPGTANGAFGVGMFDNPVSVAIEASGSLVVSDFDNSRLRRVVAADGTLSTLTVQSGFQRPFGLAVAGNVLYAQTDTNPSGVRNLTTGTIWQIDGATGVATAVGPNLGRPRGIRGAVRRATGAGRLPESARADLQSGDRAGFQSGRHAGLPGLGERDRCGCPLRSAVRRRRVGRRSHHRRRLRTPTCCAKCRWRVSSRPLPATA